MGLKLEAKALLRRLYTRGGATQGISTGVQVTSSAILPFP